MLDMKNDGRQTGNSRGTSFDGLKVGVVNWVKYDNIVHLISDTFGELGCKVVNFRSDDTLPTDLDVVIPYGPYGSIVPLTNQLLACPPSQRPLLTLFQSEQFPNPALPEWFRYTVGLLRSRMERAAFRKTNQGQWQICPYLRPLTGKAIRFRYYGDLYWLRHKGLLSVIAVASAWTAEFLRARGFNVISVPGFGFPLTPKWGADLKLERDIDVLWIGKTGSKRRGRLLQRIRAELQARDVNMLFIDGVENPYVFGKERTKLLNRTKIVLNLLRKEWDENAMRYYLATLNRALIVTEPTLPHHPPFVNGVHLIEVPTDQMAYTICYYLSHEKERQQIVEQAYQLITGDLTLKNTLSDILQATILDRNEAPSAAAVIAPSV